MMVLLVGLCFLGCLVCSALYSGSELGFYSLSRVQVELDARRGSRSARLAQWLLKDDSALLITILIGNNLALEIATHLADGTLGRLGLGDAERVLLTALGLSPLVFLFSEALPKELFRRRPYGLLRLAVLLVAASRLVFWPLERLLRGLSWLLEWALGVRHGQAGIVAGREAVVGYLEEGRRTGALSPRAAALAHNALALRSIPITRAMVDWPRAVTLCAEDPDADLREQVRTSRFSRLPVVSRQGLLQGYVHQLDVLGAGPAVPVLEAMRELPVLAPETSVSEALSTLRVAAKRAAVVGTAEKPLGLLTLKDLVEEISGDLAGL